MSHKWSTYSHLFEKEGRYFLYSSLSNSFALLDRETYDSLSLLSASKLADQLDEEVLSTLTKMQAIDVDEDTVINQIRFLSQKKKYTPHTLSLTINPTLACNFNCPYCFEKEHPSLFMTDEVENAIVDFVKGKENLKHLDVMWFGGEPLIAFKRLEHLTSRLAAAVPSYTASMITNGYLLTPDVTDKLEALHIQMVQITLDGLSDTHDKKRCLKNGSPTFQHIINNIKYCAKAAPSVRLCVRVNIDSSNTDDYFKVYDYLQSLGLDSINVSPGFIVDHDTDSPSCAFNNEQIVKFLCNIYAQHRLKPLPFYPSPFRSSCAARSINTLVIGPEGELYKCWEEVGRKDAVVGNLLKDTINHKLMLRYVTGIDQLDDPSCQQCSLLPICDGGCPRARMLNKYEKQHVETCCLLKDGMPDLLYSHYLSKTIN